MNIPRNALYAEIGQTTEEHIAWFHRWQETEPVRYRPEYDLWEVFRYHDVQHVLTNHATFGTQGILPDALPVILGKLDPPDHRRLRSLSSKAFTLRRIGQLAPRLATLIDMLLEPALAEGRLEIVAQLAMPLPAVVIAEMLGLPPEDQANFRRWSYDLLDMFVGAWQPDNSELLHYFSDLLEARKRDPRDDLMSAFLAAEEDDTRLTRDEILYLCLELLVAGNVSTTILLSHALHRCCTQPEIFAELRMEPSLIPTALEEFLRYEFAIENIWRIARVDTVLGNQEIKAGQIVVAWAGAANFDETVFPHAHRFDMRRTPNPHLTFSHGAHSCLGAPLARMESRVALERLVTHFSAIRLDTERPPTFRSGPGKMMESLSVLLTP